MKSAGKRGVGVVLFVLTAVMAAVVVAYYVSTQVFHIDDSATRLPAGASFEPNP